MRFPVVYLPHGGGPWPFVDMGMDPREKQSLTTYLESLPEQVKTPPKAVLAVSAHWEEAVPTVMTSPRPPMLYDYYGFPPAAYTLTWPAPGDPKLAARVRELLTARGFESAENAERGFDHGTFVPLKLAFPDANVPTVQLSLMRSLDAGEHVRMGRALAPLRDEDVLIVGSGMSYHNMKGFRGGTGSAASEAFDAWIKDTVTRDSSERDARLREWTAAPRAREVHPREEHLLPLMVAAGAAGSDRGTVAYSDVFMGVRISGVQFG